MILIPVKIHDIDPCKNWFLRMNFVHVFCAILRNEEIARRSNNSFCDPDN